MEKFREINTFRIQKTRFLSDYVFKGTVVNILSLHTGHTGSLTVSSRKVGLQESKLLNLEF